MQKSLAFFKARASKTRPTSRRLPAKKLVEGLCESILRQPVRLAGLFYALRHLQHFFKAAYGVSVPSRAGLDSALCGAALTLIRTANGLVNIGWAG